MTCSSHTIEARDLVNAVLADINYFAELALRDEKAVKALQAKLNTLNAAEAKAYEREQRKLQKRAAELDKLFTALYEDRVMERISERNYALVSGKYEQERLDIEKRLNEIDAELTVKGANQRGITDFLALIKGYCGITELTAATVNALIDRITVSERTTGDNGATEQRIRIYYKFVGNLHELYIAAHKLAPHIEEKACERCGIVYLPGSNVARYCPACRETVRKETAERTNDRRREKRGGKPLLPKPCIACGEIFTPKSHNARFCPACFSAAKTQAAKEWSAAYYQKQKAAATV
jgi:predicted RNA-binding Zn-ribbon protein involved in translation (DUF1610 family)